LGYGKKFLLEKNDKKKEKGKGVNICVGVKQWPVAIKPFIKLFRELERDREGWSRKKSTKTASRLEAAD